MFFKKKPDPKKMEVMAGSVGEFIKLSLNLVDKEKLTEADQAVVDCFLFGAVDFIAQSNKIGDTKTVSKIAGLVLTKYLYADMDTAWQRVHSMASMSNDKAGKEVMYQGGKAFKDFMSNNPDSILVLQEIIDGRYFEAEL